jgi:hypothetical protein
VDPPGKKETAAVLNRKTRDDEDWVAYMAILRRAEPSEPERRLLRAVLEDALQTLLKRAATSGMRARRLRDEDLAWLVSEERSDVFAFESICETLGINASWLRTRVLTQIRSGAEALPAPD